MDRIRIPKSAWELKSKEAYRMIQSETVYLVPEDIKKRGVARKSEIKNWSAYIYSFSPALPLFSLFSLPISTCYVGPSSAPEIPLLTPLSRDSVYTTDLGWKRIYSAFIPLIYTVYRHSQSFTICRLAPLGWYICTLSS
jgi:hypothetical protein